MKRPRVHLGRKHQVKLWIPPEPLMDVAQSRIAGHVGYFLDTTHDIVRYVERLRTLAAACYLQGLTDMADAVVRKELGQ